MKPAIWWIRRDLRLKDNQALQAALVEHPSILPLFILDQHILSSSNERRNTFLYANLAALDRSLQKFGNHLVIRSGDPFEVLQHIMQECEADAIFAEEDFTPYALARDLRAKQRLPLHLAPGLTIQHPARVQKGDGTPFIVFTPYSKQWKEDISAISTVQKPIMQWNIPNLSSEPIPSFSSHPLFPEGEEEAEMRLTAFLSQQAASYHVQRDKVAESGTSRLSPYFHLGVLSIRSAYQQALRNLSSAKDNRTKQGLETWIEELIWREFYFMILYHFPAVAKGPFRERFSRVPWRDNEKEFDAWKNGETGYPIVDAGMRQLFATGWMHNRARMIVASFLCKDLLINWQWGEVWFNAQLVDGDLAANNGGWQWCAGCGTDAAPYFRVFNPVLQAQKFDPSGEYIRTWLPELRAVPDQYILTPWQMPPDVQANTQCMIGKHYPQPIVEHAFARQRALDAYSKIKN